MEKRITDRFNQKILDQALELYGISPEDVQSMDGFESYIYAITRGDKESILRIAHSIRRSPNLIRGELDWINYLYSGGAGVARALPSENNRWVEEIEDGAGGYFLATVFEKARGDIHREPLLPDDLLWEYGNQVGQMHKLTTAYQPSDPSWKRPDWDDPIHLEVQQFIPPQDQNIKDIYRDLIAKIRSLPVERDAYGLIHRDAHRGNFFVDENGNITLFDFDDSSYSWFVEDIALVLFYAVMGQENPVEFTENFLKSFLPGYFSAYSLDLKWFREIPLFIKLRELDLYAVIHRSFDVANLEDPWCIWYLDGRKHRIEEGILFLDFDFENFPWDSFR